jgi:hypothetical protein
MYHDLMRECAIASVPLVSAPTDSRDFEAIMNAVSYTNSSSTVTFKLIRPVILQL